MQAWKESIDMGLVNLILTTSGCLVLQRMQGPPPYSDACILHMI